MNKNAVLSNLIFETQRQIVFFGHNFREILWGQKRFLHIPINVLFKPPAFEFHIQSYWNIILEAITFYLSF